MACLIHIPTCPDLPPTRELGRSKPWTRAASPCRPPTTAKHKPPRSMASTARPRTCPCCKSPRSRYTWFMRILHNDVNPAHSGATVVLLKCTLSHLPPLRIPMQIGLELAVLVFTVFAVFVAPDVLFLWMVSVVVALASLVWLNSAKAVKELELDLAAPQKEFLSDFRALMMMMVVCAILAVDFNVFPREFAKTETFGTGTMDLGVGILMLASSMVAAGRGSIGLRKSLLSAVPLVALGLGRVLSVKLSDYAEHISEYGVHWNYFFTLAAVSIAAACVNIVLPTVILQFAGPLLIVGHQICLSYFGLQDFVMNAPRDTWISANKEGLVSITGYLGVYFVGLSVGKLLLGPSTRNQYIWGLRLFLVAACVSAVLLEACQVVGLPPSRRLVNMSYIIWTLMTACVAVAISLGGQLYLYVRPVHLMVVRAINRNQLAVFLLANLLTGAVNLLMRTLCASDSTAITIVTTYMILVTGTAVALDAYNITLRI